MCSKAFVRKSTLVQHGRIHTGEKPYQCGQCGKDFRHQPTLTAHRRIPTGEWPYECKVCGKAFRRTGNLTCHQKTHAAAGVPAREPSLLPTLPDNLSQVRPEMAAKFQPPPVITLELTQGRQEMPLGLVTHS